MFIWFNDYLAIDNATITKNKCFRILIHFKLGYLILQFRETKCNKSFYTCMPSPKRNVRMPKCHLFFILRRCLVILHKNLLHFKN